MVLQIVRLTRLSAVFALFLVVTGCAEPITRIALSPAVAARGGKTRAEVRALALCAGVARHYGLEGTLGSYAKRTSNVFGSDTFTGPSITISDRVPPSLLVIDISGYGAASPGIRTRISSDLSAALTDEFGADSNRVTQLTWTRF